MAPIPCHIQSCERVSTELYHCVSSPVSLLCESWLHLQTILSCSGCVTGKALLDLCQAAKSPQRQRENFSFSVFDLDELMQHYLSPELSPAECGKWSSGQSKADSQHCRKVFGLLLFLCLPLNQLSALLHIQLCMCSWNILV